MLDFHKLKTPPYDGDLLILPQSVECARLLRENARNLSTTQTLVGGQPLSDIRKATRLALVGETDRPLVVIGHQPELFHAGVWAKHVMARRLADATGGVALNLVVDNDVPRSTNLVVPAIRDGRLRKENLPFFEAGSRRVYEELPAIGEGRCEELTGRLRGILGEAWDASVLPVFFKALRDSSGAGDGVAQLIATRRAVDVEFGVEPLDVRVSAAPWGALLVELATHARRFAECYNMALAAYRVEHRVRGAQRPIPDLLITSTRVELPVWAVRRGRPRARVFVEGDGRRFALFAESDLIGECSSNEPRMVEAWSRTAPTLETSSGQSARAEARGSLRNWDGVLMGPMADDGGWRLRPRALTLTIWARLFLADLFIHGIGGAKYDRITDHIIRDYFGIEPPPFACVSATLHLDWAKVGEAIESPAQVRREIRDRRWNPQRYTLRSGETIGLLERCEAAIAESEALRERNAPRVDRRRVFEGIREAKRKMFENAGDSMSDLERRLIEAGRADEQGHIARDREYFFAMHSRASLERLAAAVPRVEEFRI